MADKKKTKVEANYRAGFGEPRCNNCEFHSGGKACSQVEGDVFDSDVCDCWLSKDARNEQERFGKSWEDYAKEQPSEDIPAEKAKEILADGEVHGKPLSDKQEGLMQAAAHKND